MLWQPELTPTLSLDPTRHIYLLMIKREAHKRQENNVKKPPGPEDRAWRRIREQKGGWAETAQAETLKGVGGALEAGP